MDTVSFGAADYAVFTISLVASLGIGVYFAFFGKKVKSADEYLYGGKKMKAIPVGLSLFSSAWSAITIIGIPTEIYYYGTGYLTGIIGNIIGCYIIWIIILPIFCGNLNIKTPYEYFERRFDNKVKLFLLFINIFRCLCMMPIVIYAPSLALSQATQIHVLIISTIIGWICIIYTTFGGFKTVVWTDTLQAMLMLLSCLFIAISGVIKAGGLSEIWKIADEGKRLMFFNMDPNPFVRTTFWTAIIGMTTLHLGYSGISAGSLQRYMSLPSENQAKISTFIAAGGTMLIVVIGGITGLTMYAIYNTCDPVMNKEIKNPNQLVPYFVTQTLEYIPGFSGFFIAGLLSAALSTLSSELNVVSGIIYYDFLVKYCKNSIIQNRGTFIMKMVVIINGIFYLVLVPLLQNNDHIYELILVVVGILYGPYVGIMLLGILVPKCNSLGAIVGAITSLAIMIWIQIGSSYNQINSHYKLPTNINNCTHLNNITITTYLKNEEMALDDIFILYRLSYLYIGFVGTIITIVIGILISYITGTNNLEDIDPVLVAPFLRSYVVKYQNTESIILT